ncbi:MAG TPA: hypothetical protein VFB12_24670 [Ktedonobacteraceae bacterium]|nr:hypothetical protein [Ktedonobacteraceae bacterium]
MEQAFYPYATKLSEWGELQAHHHYNNTCAVAWVLACVVGPYGKRVSIQNASLLLAASCACANPLHDQIAISTVNELAK